MKDHGLSRKLLLDYLPAGDPVLLTGQDLEARLQDMGHLRRLIDHSKKSDSVFDSTGKFVGHRLRKTFGFRQENQRAEFDFVPQDRTFVYKVQIAHLIYQRYSLL